MSYLIEDISAWDDLSNGRLRNSARRHSRPIQEKRYRSAHNMLSCPSGETDFMQSPIECKLEMEMVSHVEDRTIREQRYLPTRGIRPVPGEGKGAQVTILGMHVRKIWSLMRKTDPFASKDVFQRAAYAPLPAGERGWG